MFPTARAAPGCPASSATSPYVTTSPASRRRSTVTTSSSNDIGVDPAAVVGYAGGMSDVPENDALEQATDVEDLPEPAVPNLGREVPEADALEQAVEVPVIDEDY